MVYNKYIKKRRKTLRNQKGKLMFKYEQEIQEANKVYQKEYEQCKLACNDMLVCPVDAAMCRFVAFGDGTCIVEGYEEWRGSLSFNARLAIKKYYNFIEGEGYVRVKESNGLGVNRSDRDQFERNNINYPNQKGLYLIGQTFFNPITDEKFYWVKVG